MRLLNLPMWLETWGLTYVLVEGWETRGAPDRDGNPQELADTGPYVVLGHHTATSSAAKGDLPTLRILRDGRSDLRGPLSQVGLSRSGVVHIVAAGKANHAGRGQWQGVRSSTQAIGIEAEHSGKGRWPDAQMEAFDRLAACLLWGLQQPYSMYCHHKEYAEPAGRKVDCNFDPSAQRGRIARLLVLGPQPQIEPPPMELPEEETVSFIFTSEGKAYLRDGGDTVHIPYPNDLGALLKVTKNVGELSPEMTRRLLEAAKQ